MIKALDFTEIVKKHKGQWVGLTEDEKKVVSSGKTAKETLERAREKGYEDPILFKVPVAVLPHVGGNSINN